ncbi:MAG: ABC transporter ATP-binding protein, partial [Alphaproteobacteria bacterium]|nr:ABC transporter ATP-binding protein [Alphaproteobacteria bacterium]
VGAYARIAHRLEAAELARRVAMQVGLGARLEQSAQGLTVAGRKRLELARALATQPRLLLLDEVMAGLNPAEITEIVQVIRGIRDSGVTIFLIEHVMQAVMSLSEYTYVLNNGALIAEGEPKAVASDPHVIEAYLGHGAAERIKKGHAHA